MVPGTGELMKNAKPLQAGDEDYLILQ